MIDDDRDDAELVERARAGDARAFETLYRRHQGSVGVVVRAIVHDREQADDVVQEAFTRSLHGLDSLRDANRFAPWLCGIARHVATDQLRQRGRVQPAADDEELDGAAEGPGPEELAELAELSRLVDAGMTRLAPRDATAVALVTHLSFTPAEVAIALDVTYGAAKVIIHRARRRLRDALFVELLERGLDAGCPSRPALVDADEASRDEVLHHVIACSVCTERLTSEVRGFRASGHSPSLSTTSG